MQATQKSLDIVRDRQKKTFKTEKEKRKLRNNKKKVKQQQ